MTRNTIAILALAISFLLPSTLWADALLLKPFSPAWNQYQGGHEPVEGRVLSVSPEGGVLLNRAGEKIVIDLKDVDAIYFGADAVGRLSELKKNMATLAEFLGGLEGSHPILVRARIAKAQADARTLVSAISMYSATFAALPAALSDLTETRTMNGATGGPFMRALPVAPPGWSAYRYARQAGGVFTISTSGDGTTVSVP